MPREGKTSLTVSTKTRDQLNQARQARDQTWDAFLQDCLHALHEDQDEGQDGVRVAEVSDDVLDEIGARAARHVTDELQTGGL